MVVVYTLRVHTGNRHLAGTNNYISVLLRGTKGASAKTKLNGCLFQDSEIQNELICADSLGDLIQMEVHSKPFLSPGNNWFCSKISVMTPEGDTHLFPCYRWVDYGSSLVLSPAPAKFLFQETNPIVQKQRRRALEESQGNFRWRVYVEGLPQTVNADKAKDLPEEVRFSFSKAMDFDRLLEKELAFLNTQHLAKNTEQWKSYSELDQVLCEKRSLTYEYVRKHWDEDELFGYQFLNGINPMMIQRCSKLPENFPVTEEMVKDSLKGSTLEQEMQNGHIFLCDYKILDGLMGNVHVRQQYLTAPLVLLYNNPEGLMLPIAIQLMQKPGTENPIFLPADLEHDWLLAKIFVRSAEFALHEVDFHLLRTHLLAEVFTMATLRNLPSMHPLFKLLFPHIRYTLQINIMARNMLLSKEIGYFINFAAVGGDSLPKLMRRATASLTYSSLCLPDNISERGLGNVPNYYYRDDGTKLWNIIDKFVEGVLTHFYKSDINVQRDTELQQWIREIFTNGFLGSDSTGIPKSFNTMKYLIKFVTMVIFTASVQHASVNAGQFDFGGWMPNFPSGLRKPHPKQKGQTNEDTILETLPDVGMTVNTMAILKVLSTKSTDHYPLGYFREELFEEEVPCKLMKKFQEDLKSLSGLIKERNATLELPYTFLDPENVDNSVAL